MSWKYLFTFGATAPHWARAFSFTMYLRSHTTTRYSR